MAMKIGKCLLAALVISLTAFPLNAAPPVPPTPFASGSLEAMLEVAGEAYKCGISAITLQEYGDHKVGLFTATSRATTEAMTCARDWIASNAKRLNIGAYFTVPKGAQAAAAGVVAVEFWAVGDDLLSARFHEAVEASIKGSGKFSNSGQTETALFFYAPTNVRWKMIGDRTEVQYRFEFWTPRKRTGLDMFKPQEMGTMVDKMEGTCWENEMSKCADAVIERAVRVAAKL